MNKAIFLDRDGILNVERGDYTYKIQDFQITPNIIETLKICKILKFILIVVTNQSGISQGIYSRDDMDLCHQYFQQQSGNLIDAFYHAPMHPSISSSLSRKPNSLMFERAIYRFNIDPKQSWMVGDKERDLIPARKLNLKTIFVGSGKCHYADFAIKDISKIPDIISNA